ncbi:DUF3124 domain-containing protein [Roseiconus lacunae]|uniref:DUF3124 domain-containing protein n=1 Tax=Roseiconus lacunae TaxID=2605694 RepID=A0ABT7PGN6_9BACT|nr:DUF3124 domain-containing protein [Roseiconus lacunae]MCD0458231.1 DUF3124 domain-containing protein [Roseiconus lacunae]MDM4015675.1 DUF3124 domain-containing protein [Roseiconus lacunae]WRQ52270.1 DUF3124 domain-containing protein [Stieleria sp. HD01]
MAGRITDENADGLFRRLKLLAFLTIVIPAVILVVFIELRFRSIEQSIPFQQAGTRDRYREEIDTLPTDPVAGQTLYAPAYSHIYHQKGAPYLLTVTLYVRNTDPEHEIVVSSVRYFDTGGREIRSLLNKPLRLAPLAATEFVIEKEDRIGGSGASFLVQWQASQDVTRPVVETVNVDTSGAQGISFIVPATVISENHRHHDPAATEEP